MRQVLIEGFSQAIDEILFGMDNNLRVNGLTVPEATERIFKLCFGEGAQDPLNAFTGGIAGDLGLVKPINQAGLLFDQVKNAVICEYKKRALFPTEKLSFNILDLMVRFNKTAEESEKLTLDEIVGNCVLFQNAGVDTSKSTVEFLLHHFSVHKQD